MPKSFHNVLFTELSADALAEGRLFDGLAVGSFKDMYGRVVTFKPEELDTYLSNTQAGIEATKAESGEVVGLPIDAADHDKGDGAGWIVGVEREGNRLRLLPKWTEIGRDLIRKSIRRFFSATVDTVNKVILGGTLTNWPATRNAKGQILLRPIELSSKTLAEFEESVDEYSGRVRSAFADSHKDLWATDVFEDYVIVVADGKLYKVTFTENADGIQFAGRDSWVEVHRQYVEAGQVRPKTTKPAGGTKMKVKTAKKPKGRTAAELEVAEDVLAAVTAAFGEAMATDHPDLTLTDVFPDYVLATEGDTTYNIGYTTADDGAITFAAESEWTEVTPPAENSRKPAKGKQQFDAIAFLEMHGVQTDIVNEFEQQLLGQFEGMQAEAGRRAAQMMARIRRERDTAELSSRLVSGTEDAPKGLRGVTAEDLKKHLLSLPLAEAKWFGDLLEAQVEGGLVEFTELGHSRRVEGSIELAAPFKASLKSWIANKQPIEEFFKVNAHELGDMAQYNLSEFAQKK